MIKNLLHSFLINIAAIWVVSNYTGALHLADRLKSLLLVGAVFTALHLFIKPILSAFLGPLNFLTLGLVGLIVDSALLYAMTIYLREVWITSWFFPGLTINGFILPPFLFTVMTATILSALIINIIRQVISAIL